MTLDQFIGIHIQVYFYAISFYDLGPTTRSMAYINLSIMLYLWI